MSLKYRGSEYVATKLKVVKLLREYYVRGLTLNEIQALSGMPWRNLSYVLTDLGLEGLTQIRTDEQGNNRHCLMRI